MLKTCKRINCLSLPMHTQACKRLPMLPPKASERDT
jgi:hypothetical protein